MANQPTRLQWLTLWYRLREEIQLKTSWGRNELIEKMNQLERDMVRRAELEEKGHGGVQ